MAKLVFVPPPVVAAALAGSAYGLSGAMPGGMILHAPLGGGVLGLAGLVLAASAFVSFLRQRTTPIPHGEPSSLVLAGAYRWTRNPMYLGLASALLGLALYFGTLPFFLAVPAFVLGISRIHIPYEEAKLAGLFGAAYEDFKARVPRWL